MEIILSLVVLTVLYSTAEAGDIEKFKATEKTCMEKHSVNEDVYLKNNSEVDNYEELDITLKDDTNENHRCFVECLLSEFGLVKEGIVDLDSLVALAEEELGKKEVTVNPTTLKADVVSCTAKAGEGHCMISYHAVKCLYELTKKQD